MDGPDVGWSEEIPLGEDDKLGLLLTLGTDD